MKTLDLRAHHLLCILGFRGLGYNKVFIENIEKVIEDIRSGSCRVIKIIDKCDIICSVCPYRKNNECHKEDDPEQKVKNRDSEVISQLEIKPGGEYSPEELWALIAERIAPNDISIICQGCEWLSLGYCVEGLSKLREARNEFNLQIQAV